MTIIPTVRHDGLTPMILYETPIHVIGVGGVGSHVVELLCRMQLGRPGLHLYDGDVVEAHNLPNQQFTLGHLGQHKVQAAAAQASVWSGEQVRVVTHPDHVTGRIPLHGIVFLCLDSMAARRQICEQSLFGNSAVSLVLETRMDASTASVVVFDPSNPVHQECWLGYWYPDEETENQAGCGGHYAIPTAASTTANLAVQALLNHYRTSWDETPNRIRLELARFELNTKFWPKMLDPE